MFILHNKFKVNSLYAFCELIRLSVFSIAVSFVVASALTYCCRLTAIHLFRFTSIIGESNNFSVPRCLP